MTMASKSIRLGVVDTCMRWSYRDRTEAGEVLADELVRGGVGRPLLVLAVPNGGVKVAAPMARALGADLDIVVVRKLQVPHNPEAGFGALTSLGAVFLNQRLVEYLGLSPDVVERVRARTAAQVEARVMRYRSVLAEKSPAGKHVVLVDDGLASGYTMLAAVESVREKGPLSITVAAPTASESAVRLLRPRVDRLVCPRVTGGPVFAVADAYRDWYDVPDDEVEAILRAYGAV